MSNVIDICEDKCGNVINVCVTQNDRGPQGEQGVGVENVAVGENDHLITTLTDGQTIDGGELPMATTTRKYVAEMDGVNATYNIPGGPVDPSKVAYIIINGVQYDTGYSIGSLGNTISVLFPANDIPSGRLEIVLNDIGAIAGGGGGGAVESVNGKTGAVVLDANDVGALPNSTVIPTVNNATLTIQKNGSTVETFTANSSTNKTANISVPTALSELANDAGYTKQAAIDSSISTHNQSSGAHPSILSSISGINDLIPSQATSINKLADKAFVNSTIQTASANFRGSWANWSAVPTDSTLYPVDYTGSTTPTNNDYLVVQDASGYPVGEGESALAGTWRFKYTGAWSTGGKNGWKPEYQVNEEPLTAAQIAALNSGITSALVTQIGTNTTAIAGKVDAVAGKGLSTNDFTTALQTKLSGLADITTIGSGLTLQNGTLSNALTAGTNVSITDNVISATDTTYSPFTGATSSVAGTAGLVPAPATTDVDKFLKGDGTWGTVAGGGPTVVQSTGNSTTDVMSQNAATKMIFANDRPSDFSAICISGGSTGAFPNSSASICIGSRITTDTSGWKAYNIGIGTCVKTSMNSIAIGQNTQIKGYASGNSSVLIGDTAVSNSVSRFTAIGPNVTVNSGHSVALGNDVTIPANANGSIAIGRYSGSGITAAGMMDISTTDTGYGYNSSNYRLLTGLYDGQSAHDAATVGQALGDTETYTVATSDWTALASSAPYTYSATVTATHTIGNDTIVELYNDNPVLFATNGFAVGSVSGQSVTIYSIGIPSASVTLKVNYKG